MGQTYASQPGPYQARAKEIYSDLRKNIVENVFNVRFRFRFTVVFFWEGRNDFVCLFRNMNGPVTSGSNMMLLPERGKEGRRLFVPLGGSGS
jgi:ribosomal protein S28E/S33